MTFPIDKPAPTFRGTPRLWLVVLLSLKVLVPSLLSAQVEPPPKYRVLKAEKPEQMVARLNGWADQGYRLILPGQAFILRLETAPPNTYRYINVESKGGPIQFVNWLNEQGARGYRLVRWPGADVMEKAPHPKNYEYTSPGARMYHLGQPKVDVISTLMNQGYQPLGFRWFSHFVGSSDREMFFEREIPTGPKLESNTDKIYIEIADAMHADKVMKKVDALAKYDFRYLGPCAAQKGGGLAVMMQKCGQACRGPFEYRYFDVHDPAQLDKQLSEHGKEGFRVLADSLMMRPHMLERAASKKETYTYHVLLSKDPTALEQELNSKEQDGYEPIGHVAHIGVWTGQTLLILEKISTDESQGTQSALPPSK